MPVWWATGPALEVLAKVPDGSIDVFCTSPPFWRLRSYLPDDHPDKANELGQEDTPGEFIDNLLREVAEWRRCLAPHGSIVIEIGDTSAGSGGAGGDYNDDGLREGQPKFAGSGRARSAEESRKGTDARNRGNTSTGTAGLGAGKRTDRQADLADGITPARRRPGPDGRDSIPGLPLDKSLCLIPDVLAFALAYGFNPLTGNESPAGMWRVRNEVVWARTNPVVGRDGDKFRRAHSKVIVATLARDRYWDIEELRTVPAYGITDDGRSLTAPYKAPGQTERKTRVADESGRRINANPGGAPPLDWEIGLASLIDSMSGARGIDVIRAAVDAGILDLGDVWDVPTRGYSGAHFAVFTPTLLRKPIVAMTPRRVCSVCGEPSRRIVAAEQVSTGRTTNGPKNIGRKETTPAYDNRTAVAVSTVGWTECDCEGDDRWRRGRVCDPFGGSGTVGMVADANGFDALLIDLNGENTQLARDRIGFMLTEVDRDELADVLG